MPFFLDYFGFWLLQALAMVVTCALIPKLKVTGLFGPLVAVIVIAAINTHVWDAALFFHIPTTLSKSGALLLLVNGAIFWLAVKAVPGIEIEGFIPAIVAPVVFTISSMLINTYGRNIDWSAVAHEGLNAISTTRQFFDEELSKEPADHEATEANPDNPSTNGKRRK